MEEDAAAQPILAPGRHRPVALRQVAQARKGLVAVAARVEEVDRLAARDAVAGEITRHVGFSRRDELSAPFEHLNQGKRSVAVDLKTDAGREILAKLIADSDALVSNLREPVMERLRLGNSDLQEINPDLVYVNLSGFGSQGPYANRPAYDDLIQGLSGICHLEAVANGGEPRYVPLALADRVVGLYGAIALLGGLLAKSRGRQVPHIGVSMFETMAHFVLIEQMFLGSFIPPAGPLINPRTISRDRRPYATSDGYLCLIAYTDLHWKRLFAILGRPDLESDERFAGMKSRSEHIGALYSEVAEAFKEKPTAQWLQELGAADIPVAPLHTIESLVADPHLAATGFFQETPCSEQVRFRRMRMPINWAGLVPPSLRAPQLGEHTLDVLRELGYSEQQVEEISAVVGAARR